MASWRIYYEDGSTFDSFMGAPEDAPAHGFICVVFPDERVGRMVMSGWDWYFYHAQDENWWGADVHGLLDQLCHNKPIRAVKQGRNTNTDNFNAIMDRARNDPDFPIKRDRSKRERPFQVV